MSSDRVGTFFASPAGKSRLLLLFAAMIFVASVLLLVETCDGLGYARDEGFYFEAARRYGQWLELFWQNRGAAMQRKAVDAHFVVNHEHPSLIKLLFAASHVLLQKKLGLFAQEGTSFRFPAMVLAGAMTAVTFLWGARRGSVLTGLLAAGSLLFMPQLFYHAHLACFDIPIAALFLFTLYAYDRSLHSGGPLWRIVTGVLFGLALDTKHNSWFLPIAITAHAACLAVIAYRARQSVVRSIQRTAQTLVAMAVIGPVVMVALWPWLWFDSWARFKEYAAFHLNHEYYNMEFFGSNYFEPPFPRTYAPMMTLATVPVVTLAAAIIGFAVGARSLMRDLVSRTKEESGDHSTFTLWLLAIGVSYGAWTSSSTPIFGGTKHWMTAYPLIALFAAEGVARAAASLREELELRGLDRLKLAVAPVVAFTALTSPMFQALSAHPWGLSAYTPLVGGARGAATLGLNRSFWGYTTGSLVDYLNREVPRDGAVYPHDTAWHAWEMLQRDGRLRADIRAVGNAAEADIALYHHEKHMQGQEYQAWLVFETVRPDVIAGDQGVPVIWAYRRKR